MVYIDHTVVQACC